jgi:hypothetical protein
MSRDPYTNIRKEYRALVPAQRRRRHLVLLGRETIRPQGWSTDRHVVTVLAVVRMEDRPALDPLIARYREHGVTELCIAEAEDGFLDRDMLWSAGRRPEEKVSHE